MPKLSIIIPCLNEERYVGKLLDCLKAQTFKDYEIIVSDSHSKDRTAKVVLEHQKKDRRIRLVEGFAKNVSEARNNGAKRAKAERLLFMDADVTLDNDFLEKALKEIKERKLEICGCYLTPDSGHLFDRFGHSLLNSWFFAMQYVWPHTVGQCIFSTKALHKKLRGFDGTILFAEDNDYANRAKKFATFRVLRTVRIISSTRRFENENRFVLGMKYALCPIYRMFFGEIRTNVFNYRMDLLRKRKSP